MAPILLLLFLVALAVIVVLALIAQKASRKLPKNEDDTSNSTTAPHG
ncbi:MAG: hypothetical protein QM723_31230 [Myxococcaceae bacterium]